MWGLTKLFRKQPVKDQGDALILSAVGIALEKLFDCAIDNGYQVTMPGRIVYRHGSKIRLVDSQCLYVTVHDDHGVMVDEYTVDSPITIIEGKGDFHTVNISKVYNELMAGVKSITIKNIYDKLIYKDKIVDSLTITDLARTAGHMYVDGSRVTIAPDDVFTWRAHDRGIILSKSDGTVVYSCTLCHVIKVGHHRWLKERK